ncbi:MAG: hypothetical protein S4CHLAM102_16540 [Chlamydiia bacterium]|nr:hypothetical protein [Chlamydiia bacterium]
MAKKLLSSVQILIQCALVGAVCFLVVQHKKDLDEIYSTFDQSPPHTKEGKASRLPYQRGGLTTYLGFSQYLCSSGKVVPNTDFVKVYAPVSGTIEKVFVKARDQVTAGEVLFKLETSELEIKYAEVLADLRAETAKLKSLQIDHESSVHILEKQLEEYKGRQLAASNKLKVYTKLMQTNAVSQFEFDEQAKLLQNANSEVESLQKQIEKFSVVHNRADIEIQEALIEKQEALLKHIEHKINSAHVRAAFDGMIYDVYAKNGQSVGSDPVLLCGNEDPLFVSATVAEGDLWKIRPRNETIRAVAVLRSNPNVKIDLKFVNKQNYIGGSGIDGMQLLFAFNKSGKSILAGQSVDVYIEADSNDQRVAWIEE